MAPELRRPPSPLTAAYRLLLERRQEPAAEFAGWRGRPNPLEETVDEIDQDKVGYRKVSRGRAED